MLVKNWRNYHWLMVGGVVWALVLIVTPVLIRAGYDGKWWFLNGVFSGRAEHPVELYLNVWRNIALKASIVLALLAFSLLILSRLRARLRSTYRQMVGQLLGLRDRDVMILAVWFGLIAGLAEAGRWMIGYFVLHIVTHAPVSWEMFWTIPLSAVTWLLIVALIIVALSHVVRSVAPEIRATAVVLFCFLVTFSFVRALRIGLHPVPLVILSLGIGTAVARAASERSAMFLRFARRSSLIAVAALSVFAAVLPAGRKVAMGKSFGGLRAAPMGGPNVILIIWDTVRAASMSLYGYARTTTPTLDKLAANAVVFDRAISSAPWTLPSHASLFTGLYHHQHSADRNSPLDDSAPTIAEVLRERGYQTGGFVANKYWVGSGFGLNRGFSWYAEEPPLSFISVLFAWDAAYRAFDSMVKHDARRSVRPRITAERVNKQLLRWLDARDENRPFFAFLNLYDAHEPYAPPAPFAFRFSDHIPLHTWENRRTSRFSPRELSDLRDSYDAGIYYLDYQLQLLITQLNERGLLANTLIILTSDHGEALGEQHPSVVGHSNNIYASSLHVPLLFHWPDRLNGGTRIQRTVSLIDVAATIADATDSTAASASPLPGRSLLPLLTGSASDSHITSPALSQANPASFHLRSKVWPIAKGPLYSLITDDQHYIVNARGDELVFDVDQDPWEREDITTTAAVQQVLPSYRNVVGPVRRASEARGLGPGSGEVSMGVSPVR